MSGPDAYDLAAEKTGGRAGKLLVAAGEIWDATRRERITFDQLAERLRPVQVVYVGEQHEGWHHHRLQQQLLAALTRDGARYAVGLEMLPRTVQAALDAYVGGRGGERELLDASAWYEHWGYDFRYYRSIFTLARERRLPLVALNLPGKIVRQVGRKGLGSLDAAERAKLPEVYLGSDAHRRVFAAMIGRAAHHPHSKQKAPHHGAAATRHAHFYQAQALWDEAMAERVDATLKAHPGERVMVLAGAGHVIYDLGISMRLRRRGPGLRQAIVVPLKVSKGRRRVARQLGDFIVGVPPDGPREGFPTLGVMLVEKDGALSVRGLEKKGAAARAGVHKDDQIVALDGRPVSKRAALRRWLLDKSWGDRGKLTLKRKRRELAVEVRFEPGADHAL